MTSTLQEVTKESFSVLEATHPWDRQIGETPLAYRLFAVYRDQGINRDIHEIAKDLGRGYQTVKNLSIENQWLLRADAHDNYQNRILEKKLQYEIVDARKRHHRLGAMMLDFAQESIENLRSMNDLLSVKDIVQLVDAGHKIESVALGMSTDITESRVAADIQVQQKETIPVAILERIGKEIASAKSLGEDTVEIEAQFEELAKPNLLADGNGNSEKIPVR
jgi:predicted transcriptional regulator